MPKARIHKTPIIHIRRAREGMSDAHHKMILQLPCIVTGTTPVEGHHLLRTGEHGMSRRSSDQWLVPLSAEAHRAMHQMGDEDAFFAQYGIDARAIAKALWAARGDLEAMQRIVFNNHQRAALRPFV